MLTVAPEFAAGLTDLSQKTGLSRQSIYKHRELGAPLDPDLHGNIAVLPYLEWLRARRVARAADSVGRRVAKPRPTVAIAGPGALPPTATPVAADDYEPEEDADTRLGLPATWTDEVKRRDAIGREIDNEKRRTELDQLRGKLIPRERLVEALQELPPLVKAALERHVPDHCATLVAPELAPDARKGARAPITAVLAEIAQGVERLSKSK